MHECSIGEVLTPDHPQLPILSAVTCDETGRKWYRGDLGWYWHGQNLSSGPSAWWEVLETGSTFRIVSLP